MLEIEQRFRGADFAALEERLAQAGSLPPEVQEQTDYYFNAPDRDFRHSDEVFRLRRVGPRAWLTYKGPRRHGAVKTRPELEVPLDQGEAPAGLCLQLLRHLGYRLSAIVQKRRRAYPLRRAGFDLLVCLDELPGIGRFVEVEILAPEDQLEAARAVVQDTAGELGLAA